MPDKVWIVMKRTEHMWIVESVWSSRELADSAIMFYRAAQQDFTSEYSIIERYLNKTVKP